MLIDGRLQCDMSRECDRPVTMLDEKGFCYCSGHGEARRGLMRCRKLRPHELRSLASGKTLARY